MSNTSLAAFAAGFLAFMGPGSQEARADTCAPSGTAIATDRPDVTNSSFVVPTGSLQSENGVNLSGRGGAQSVDGTNSRLRVGVAPCLEILVDLPTYFGAIRGDDASGFGNVAPAVKWQLAPLPGDVNLSVTTGIGLPTGAARIAGPGAQPYLQFPWSRELGGGWGISGMVTTFLLPADPVSKVTEETTFVIERSLSQRADVFVEYVGDFPARRGASQLFNSGAVYRVTPTQQIDVHVGFGLNHNAPDYVVGVGYSIRLDGLF